MDNQQQTPDWATQLQQLRHIREELGVKRFLAHPLRQTRAFLDHFHNAVLVGRLEEIENDHRLMCDFLRKGYPDERRQELYDSLIRKLHRLLRDMELALRLAHDPAVTAYAPAKTNDAFDAESIRVRLEAFVSDVAMASLDPEEVRADKVRALHADHHQYVQGLFAHLLFAPQWSHEYAMAMADLVVSPTVDANDAQLMVSGIMLGSMLSGDGERLRALLRVYRKAADEHVRQRALVGWALALNSESVPSCPQIDSEVGALLQEKMVRDEIVELQIQMVYCRNAKRDNEKLQKDILPNLFRAQGINISGASIRENDDTPLDEILNGDAADQKMEEMEQSIRKMMDMRDQGVDIYFGGFSKMKRFSFFYTLCNWFVPFYAEHPQLQHVPADFLHSAMVRALLSSGTFCESDKYSFVLGTSSVFHNLPANIREMLGSGEVSMVGMPDHPLDAQAPTFIRRMVLQDLYRFFTICDARKMFASPFDTGRYLFLTNVVFRRRMGDGARRVQKFLLKQKMYAALSSVFYNFKEADNVDDMRMEALLLMHGYRYLEAHALYARILDLQPDDERAMTGCAQACFHAEAYADAAHLYGQLHELHPDNRAMALNYAIAQINSDEADEAMKLLYRLDYERAGDLGVKRAMAWGHLRLGHLDQAEELYREILATSACDASDRLNAGYCHWFAGRVDMAITLIQQAAASTDDGMKTVDDLLLQFAKDVVLMKQYDIAYIEQQMVAELVVAGAA